MSSRLPTLFFSLTGALCASHLLNAAPGMPIFPKHIADSQYETDSNSFPYEEASSLPYGERDLSMPPYAYRDNSYEQTTPGDDVHILPYPYKQKESEKEKHKERDKKEPSSYVYKAPKNRSLTADQYNPYSADENNINNDTDNDDNDNEDNGNDDAEPTVNVYDGGAGVGVGLDGQGVRGRAAAEADARRRRALEERTHQGAHRSEAGGARDQEAHHGQERRGGEARHEESRGGFEARGHAGGGHGGRR